MLFDLTHALESKKERNFYSKVFAGYYFNELIPGYESRLRDFTGLLRADRGLTFSGSLDEQFRLSEESTHVTFDFHGYLVDEKNDRGELADILIADIENKSVVAVEVKFLSDWDFEKDVIKASCRFRSLLTSRRISSFAHVLLITRDKLDAAQRALKREGSNWRKLASVELGYPVVVVTWEDIAESCKGPDGTIVSEFIYSHIEKSKKCFRDRAREIIG